MLFATLDVNLLWELRISNFAAGEVVDCFVIEH